MVIRRVRLISTRREWLQRMGLLGGGALLSGVFTTIACGRTATPDPEAEAIEAAPAGTTSALDASRAQMAASPIEMMELGAGMVLLSGPGGNVVVLDGADGKFVVDTFVQPAWTPLKAALDGMGPSPLTAVINTHWHFDHSDNNARFREAGARIVAHENTAVYRRTRIGQRVDGNQAAGLTANVSRACVGERYPSRAISHSRL